MKKLGRIILLCFAFVILLNLPITCYANEMNLHAAYVAVIDADTGRLLYGKEQDCQVPMASTTKILTCILALEQGDFTEHVTVSSYAQSMPQVRMGIRSGEQYQLEDLLYALMLESYNDVAVAIAEHISGSVEAFAQVMNDKAKSIGCESFYFITPNGLDSDVTIQDQTYSHSISAKDLAKIMAYCCTESEQNEQFLQITRTKSKNISDVDHKRSFSLTNHNQMLQNSQVVSGKTGFTGKAGYCYVSHVKVKDQPISIALLACGWPNHKTYKWQDMSAILDYLDKEIVIHQFREVSVQLPDVVISNVQHKVGQKSTQILPITGLSQIDMEETVIGLQQEQFFCKVHLKEHVNAPIKEGTQLGEIKFYIGESLIKTVGLFAEDSYEENNFYRCLFHCVDWFLTNCLKRIA